MNRGKFFYVTLVLAGALTEDFCGVEPVTHPPDIIETRPPPDIDEEKLREIYRDTESAIVGGNLKTLFTVLHVMIKKQKYLCNY